MPSMKGRIYRLSQDRCITGRRVSWDAVVYHRVCWSYVALKRELEGGLAAVFVVVKGASRKLRVRVLCVYGMGMGMKWIWW